MRQRRQPPQMTHGDFFRRPRSAGSRGMDRSLSGTPPKSPASAPTSPQRDLSDKEMDGGVMKTVKPKPLFPTDSLLQQGEESSVERVATTPTFSK